MRDPQLTPPQKKYGILVLYEWERAMIEINKGIPVPISRIRRAYPYDVMDIGDSFHVEEVSLPVMCNSNWRNGKKLGMKFIAAKDEKGIRVWRIE